MTDLMRRLRLDITTVHAADVMLVCSACRQTRPRPAVELAYPATWRCNTCVLLKSSPAPVVATAECSSCGRVRPAAITQYGQLLQRTTLPTNVIDVVLANIGVTNDRMLTCHHQSATTDNCDAVVCASCVGVCLHCSRRVCRQHRLLCGSKHSICAACSTTCCGKTLCNRVLPSGHRVCVNRHVYEEHKDGLPVSASPAIRGGGTGQSWLVMGVGNTA